MDTLELFWSAAWPKIFEAAKVLVIAILFWLIGKRLIKMVLKLLGKVMEKSKMEASAKGFLLSLIKFALYGILIVVIAGTIGIETSSVIALIGSIGLTVGLALQGSLSNFAGGVLILILKPFIIGDYIVANGQEGTVTGIDIFYTKLLTVDNRAVVLPNGALANSNIVNVSKEPTRRVDLVASVAYESDVALAKKVLFELASECKFSFSDETHPIQVYVDSYGSSAISIGLRFWVKSEDYWDAKWDATEKIKETFDKNGITIPFNQLDVSIKK